jgi:hypothetical protein
LFSLGVRWMIKLSYCEVICPFVLISSLVISLVVRSQYGWLYCSIHILSLSHTILKLLVEVLNNGIVTVPHLRCCMRTESISLSFKIYMKSFLRKSRPIILNFIYILLLYMFRVFLLTQENGKSSCIILSANVNESVQL